MNLLIWIVMGGITLLLLGLLAYVFFKDDPPPDDADLLPGVATGNWRWRVRPEQVASVVGYADRHLANAADPFDAANRRISIIVRPRDGAARPSRSP